MAAKDDLINDVNGFFNGDYTVTNGTVIPNVSDLAFAKEGKEIPLAMLFIDINESTTIVDGIRRITAAKMYKSFLYGVARIARMNDGELRSFNGDGVLVVFIGDTKCTHAAKAALQMNWFVREVLKPKIQAYIDSNSSISGLDFDCGIGIDTGKILVVRGGIRGDNNNDLVWVGNATNYAVKLAKVSGKVIYISKDVYTSLMDLSKFGGNPQQNMWTKYTWNSQEIYGSDWTWSV